jgi:hypothetical protein
MSYDDTLPSDLDKVRHILGDTSNDSATELLTDDHIEAMLASYSYNIAVAHMAPGLAGRFAQEPDRVTLPSGLSVAWSERVKYWLGLAAQMLAGGVAGVYTSFSRTPTRTDGYSEYQAGLE